MFEAEEALQTGDICIKLELVLFSLVQVVVHMVTRVDVFGFEACRALLQQECLLFLLLLMPDPLRFNARLVTEV